MKWGNTAVWENTKSQHCWKNLVLDIDSAGWTDHLLHRHITVLKSNLSGGTVSGSWITESTCHCWSIHLVSHPTTQTQYCVCNRSTREIPNSNTFNWDMTSERLTWSSTSFFVTEKMWIWRQEKRSDLNPAALVLPWCPFAHHESTEECLVATKPLWLDTILLRTAAANARARERGERKGERKKCCVVYCFACVGSHHCSVFLKHIQRQLWQEERQAVREWQREPLWRKDRGFNYKSEGAATLLNNENSKETQIRTRQLI